MTVFWLVRHGAYPLLDHALGGRAGHALDAAGIAQAQRAARVIAGANIANVVAKAVAKVVSSPVARAAQTAAPIAAALGLAVDLEPAFSEIDFAAWTGLSFEALACQPEWKTWNEFRGSACVPGGESMLGVQARAMAAIMRLAASWPDSEVVVVSHADVIRAVLAHVLGMPLDLLRRIQIDPGSMSRVAFYAADARVLDVNLR